MKKYLLILLVALMGLTFPSCRSKKEAAGSETIAQEEVKWKNVAVPVKLELLEPQRLTLSGRATMVRGEYVYISLRMLGFEVAQIYLTPQEADVVVKQLQKMWIQEPIGDKLGRIGTPFTVIQEAMLGEPDAISSLPEKLDLTVGGTRETPVLTLRITKDKQTLLGRMTLSLSDARWDEPVPAGFVTPGKEYTRLGIKELQKIFK